MSPRVLPRSVLARSVVSLTAVALLVLLAACDAPRWHAEAVPGDALLVADGTVRRAGPIDAPIPYYGTVDLAAVPTLEQAPDRTATRALLVIDEPVTPWIFPFDCAIECAVALFVPDPVRAATLVLPERTDVPAVGEAPAGLDAFLERAHRAAVAR